MNSKPFKMPYPQERQALDDALWKYYELCFPDYDEDERNDLTRDVLIVVDEAVRRYQKAQRWANDHRA